MKPLTRDVAARTGGVRGEWTSEALERARAMANELRTRVPEMPAEGSPSASLRAAFHESSAGSSR